MKYLKLTLLSIIITLGNSTAQDTKYGGAFLELGVGARALGLGSAYVALADDGSGFYWNPAGTAFLKRPNVSLMYANLFNSLENHGYVSASVPLFGGAVVAASWIRLAVEKIPRYDDIDFYDHTREERYADPEGIGLRAAALGTFAFTNNAYFVTFSRLSRVELDLGWQYFKLPVDIAYGVNFKMIDIGLDNRKGSGLGLDVGFILAMGLDDLFADDNFGRLSVGFSIHDIFNTPINWDTESKQKDEIERKWNFGFAYSQPLNFIQSDILIAYDIDTKYDGSYHLGLEFLYKKLFAVRIGSYGGDFTAGAGLSYWRIKLDYAYQLHDLGNSHRVGVSFYF
jgi:hypothetical protein